MARTHFRLDTRRRLADGTYPLKVAVGYGTGILLSVKVYLREDEWNARAQMATGRNARQINRVLDSIITRVVGRIHELRERGMWETLSRAQKVQMLTDTDLTAPTVSNATLGDVFREVIASKRGSTAASYRAALGRLRAFADPDALPVARVSRAFVEDFARSLEVLSVNSAALYLEKLRAVVSHAVNRDLLTSDPFRGFHIRKEETAVRALPPESVRRLATMDLGGRDADMRDMFVLSFLLVGINNADLYTLTPSDVRDGRVEYRRKKTGKLYSIRIEPEARAILDRHRGERRLVALPGLRAATVADFTAALNRSLRRLGARLDPPAPDISSYSARYSWATIAASLDIPRDTISEALGHSYGSAVTGVYIKFSRDKIDAANRKVIDFVLGGHPM